MISIFKRSLAVAILSLVMLPTFAQTSSEEYEFNPHWNAQIQGGVGYTVGETSFSKLLSPTAALYVGYQFTPVFSLRAGLGGWEGKGAQYVLDDPYKFNYIQGNIDAMVDVASIFLGYKSDRFFKPFVFAGVGYNYGFNNDEANALADPENKLANLWDGSLSSFAGHVGVGAAFRATDKLDITLEVNTNLLSDKFNSKRAATLDWQYNLMAGLVFKFGETKTAVTPSPSAEDLAKIKAAKEDAERRAKDAEERAAKAKAAADAKPKEIVVVKDAERTSQNVFFNIASSEVNDIAQLEIDSIVEYLKKNDNCSVTVVGYADAKTGKSSYNEKLSKARAEAVQEAIIDGGIASDRVSTSYKGDEVQPFEVNDLNRVVICVYDYAK